MFERLPPLRALQAFEAVGRLGTVASAALDLNVSPGAISQHIHALEREVGVSLFERQGRRLALTSWGRIYLERIQIGFEHLRAANEVLQRARLKSGIVLSAPPSLAIRWLRPLMASWQGLAPGVNMRLIGEDEEPVFAEKEVDFRISYGTARLRYGHFVDLFRDWVVPVCSPAVFASRPQWTASDILSGPLIGTEWVNPHQSPPSWAGWASRFGFAPPTGPSALSFSLSSVAIDAALHDGGFVLGQYSMISDDLATGRLVVATDHWMRLDEPYALAWNPASLDRPFGPEFRNFLIRAGRPLEKGPAR